MNIDTSQYAPQVRANARLVDLGRKAIAKCPVVQQIEICVVLIADWGWTLDESSVKQIPADFREGVKTELGLE